MAENMFSELARVIEQVGKDKGIDRLVVIDAITQGMLVAARKKYGTYRDIEANYNEESGEVELFQFKEVVEREKYIDDEVVIPLDDALKLDPNAALDDSIGIKLDSKDLGRIAAQTAKQIIMQKVRDAEREIVFNEFEQRKGEIASGIARRVERGAIVVDMGRTEAYIPPREQIPGEQYKPGDRIQGYLSEVRQTTRGPQIIMSRADERYLMKLFEMEVPEIYDGIVELRGEKIDIVPWDEDITRFACNALAPAEISRVFLDEDNKELEIVVPDNQLSLAIGKKGQNVRLAAKLTGWKIDIMSESSASARTSESIFNLMLIPGMTDTMAQNIFQSGFGSFVAISQAAEDEIMTIPGYDTIEKAEKLIADAKSVVEKYKAEGIPVPTSPAAQMSVKPTGGDAKAQADLRLKQELEKLESQTQSKEEQ